MYDLAHQDLPGLIANPTGSDLQNYSDCREWIVRSKMARTRKKNKEQVIDRIEAKKGDSRVKGTNIYRFVGSD